MNKVLLIGRLTREPEVRKAQNSSGTTVARFTLAVDRSFKIDGQPTADYISCVAFGKQAEHVEKYFFKGIKIAIEGRIQTGSFEDKDGTKHYTTDVVIDRTEFVESKKSDDEPKSESPKSTPKKPTDGFENIPDGIDEELPFN